MSNFKWIRKYVGPVKALVLDFSGTTCDKYVIAPAIVFRDVFKKFGVDISISEARGPMGMRKDLHMRALLRNPAIAARWKEKYGREGTDEDVLNMFHDFVPMQLAAFRKYGTLIPGIAQTISKMCRDFNVKIGVSTGATRVMADVLSKEAQKQGFIPDAVVAVDDVASGAGGGAPFMIYKNMDIMGISPIQSVVKIDDTTSGIEEGINAGCWTVGVARYSNHMDINSLEEEATLGADEIERRTEHCRDLLRRAGAHYIIDDINSLPDVVVDINTRLANGESPL